jgi:hypothetical protein
MHKPKRRTTLPARLLGSALPLLGSLLFFHFLAQAFLSAGRLIELLLSWQLSRWQNLALALACGNYLHR